MYIKNIIVYCVMYMYIDYRKEKKMRSEFRNLEKVENHGWK